MKKNNKRIFLFIVLSILMISLLLTTSYAWFSNNQEVETSNIKIKTKVSEDMKISVDAISWKSSVTLYDITNANYNVERLNQIPSNFQAYSSIGELDEGLIKMFRGFVSIDKTQGSVNYGKKVLNAEEIKEIDGIGGGFLTFDLYFSSNVPTNIYLGKNSYVKYVGDINGIENTLRIAFVVEGNTKNKNDINAIQSLKTTNQNNVVIWEANSDTHTENAIAAAASIYKLNISEKNEPLTYYGVKKEISDAVLLNSTDSTYFSLMDNNITTPSTYGTTSTVNRNLFYIQDGITKVRVYAWIEGQDVDCENSAAGSDFEFNINFTTKVKE